MWGWQRKKLKHKELVPVWWMPVSGENSYRIQTPRTRLCLLEFLSIKEIGWVHPLMPLGYFSSFSFLFVCLPVPLKDKDQGSESLIIVSFPRIESHYHLVHIFIKIRWVIHSHYRQRVFYQEDHTLKNKADGFKEQYLLLTSISFPIQSQNSQTPFCL